MVDGHPAETSSGEERTGTDLLAEALWVRAKPAVVDLL